MQGTQQITFPVTMISLCTVLSQKEKGSVSYLLTYCVDRKMKTYWKQTPSVLHVHMTALVQNKVSNKTDLFYNITLKCVKCVFTEF